MAKHGVAKALLETRLSETSEPLKDVVSSLVGQGVQRSTVYNEIKLLEQEGNAFVGKHGEPAIIARRNNPTVALQCAACGRREELGLNLRRSERDALVTGMLRILDRNKALGLCWDLTLFGLCQLHAPMADRPRKNSIASHRFLRGVNSELKVYGGVEWSRDKVGRSKSR